jgi:hypothetical protein
MWKITKRQQKNKQAEKENQHKVRKKYAKTHIFQKRDRQLERRTYRQSEMT